jgi:hypothetical protein
MRKLIIFFCLGIQSHFFAQNMGIKLPVSTLPNTTLDVNGSTAFREGPAINLTAAVNSDVTLGDFSFFRITGATTAFSITGFDNGTDGRVLTLINATSQRLTLTHQATSSANNQINTGGSDLVLAANGVAILIYNFAIRKWVVTGGQGYENAWSLTGNGGTSSATNFLGTTNGQDLIIKTYNRTALTIPVEGRGGQIKFANNRQGVSYSSSVGFFDSQYPGNIDTSFSIHGRVGENDFFKIMGSVPTTSTSTNGELHIVTGDDAVEPIIFEQFDWTTNTYYERMRILNDATNGAGVDVANHLAVGSGNAINANQTVTVSENYNNIPSQMTIGLKLAQTRTEASPTASSVAYGLESLLTYRMSGNASLGLASSVKGSVLSDGNNGFNSLKGGHFEAITSANSGVQRQLIGSYGLARNDGTGTISEATGAYADVSTGAAGTITEAAGMKGYSFLGPTGNFTTSIGIRGGSSKVSGTAGTITTGYGIYADSYNALTNYGIYSNTSTSLAGTYGNNYGTSTSAYANHAATIMTNNYGLHARVYKVAGTMTNNYGGYFDASGGSTTNYGVYSTSGNSATNNYLYYGSVTGGVNTDWGMYITGEDKNYFSGLVGIGTTNPEAALHVSSSQSGLYNDMLLSGYNNSDQSVFNIRRARGTELAPTNVANGDRLGAMHFHGYVNNAWSYLSSVNSRYKGNGLTDLSNLEFQTSGSVRMILDENGRLGIGEPIPSSKLHIATGSDYEGITLKSSSATAGGFNFKVDPNVNVFANTPVNSIWFDNRENADIAFSTSGQTHLWIKANGNVGIGINDPTHILHILGQGRSTNSAWATTSDIRLKNIDKPFEYGLKELMEINTYRFHYKENNALKLPSDKGFQGVMAQELQKVIPEAVIKQADGYFTVNTDPVFWTMLNSVKEINTANIKLKAESDALKSESLIQKEELEKLKRENELLKKSLEKTNKDIEAIKAMLEKKQN